MLSDKDLEDLVVFFLDALYKENLSDANTPSILAMFEHVGISPPPDFDRVSRTLEKTLRQSSSE